MRKGSLKNWLRLQLNLLLTAVVGNRERSLESLLRLLLYPMLPCIVDRGELFLEHWLGLLLRLATDSLNIIHR